MVKACESRDSHARGWQKISYLEEAAGRLGFAAIGFCRPETPLFFDYFREWVASGRGGDMTWLGRHLDLRGNPEKLLTGCQTVVSLAVPYSPEKPCTQDGYFAARYTEPEKADYHYRLRKMGKRLARIIADLYPGSETRICVDSAPILERSFAFLSGIGFIGKNNMCIIPGHGSFVFLMEVLTTAGLPFESKPPLGCQCGGCMRCVEACPTGALEAPFSLNASKCLSYLTLEHQEAVNPEDGEKMGQCFLGCDVCQEVCPFNSKASTRKLSLPATHEIMRMEDDDFKHNFGKTALARAGLKRIKRNISAIRSRGGR